MLFKKWSGFLAHPVHRSYCNCNLNQTCKPNVLFLDDQSWAVKLRYNVLLMSSKISTLHTASSINQWLLPTTKYSAINWHSICPAATISLTVWVHIQELKKEKCVVSWEQMYDVVCQKNCTQCLHINKSNWLVSPIWPIICPVRR